jgi:hypothetical protein
MPPAPAIGSCCARNRSESRSRAAVARLVTHGHRGDRARQLLERQHTAKIAQGELGRRPQILGPRIKARSVSSRYRTLRPATSSPGCRTRRAFTHGVGDMLCASTKTRPATWSWSAVSSSVNRPRILVDEFITAPVRSPVTALPFSGGSSRGRGPAGGTTRLTVRDHDDAYPR